MFFMIIEEWKSRSDLWSQNGGQKINTVIVLNFLVQDKLVKLHKSLLNIFT